MNDYLIGLGLSVLFTALKTFVKNPGSKEQMKKAFLKLYLAIQVAYADDTDFQGSN